MDQVRSKGKLTIFITIDTEDAYFDVPRLITGEGLPGKPGIDKIMNTMERYRIKGNFFLDMYGFKYKSRLLRDIAKSIHGRGHAVELHTHPTNLPFYNKNIYHYSLQEQIAIIEHGKNLIAEYTGESPIAHRGGSYCFNEMTLYALSELDIPIDSSRFYQSENNKLSESFTINRMMSYYNTIEIPVTYVNIMDKNGQSKNSKFDVDWLSYDELVKVIQLAKAHRLTTLTLFLHSFSFINKKSKPASVAENPSALYRDKSVGATTYCEIYGNDEKDAVKFDNLLAYITNDPDIEVLTFKQWYRRHSINPFDPGEDFVPVINR